MSPRPVNPETTEQTKNTALRIFWGQLRQTDRQHKDADKTKFLKRIPFFSNLKKRQLEQLAGFIYERDYRAGEYVFEISQPGAALFIIQSGEVSIEIPGNEDEYTQLANLGKNSFLGELALLDEAPRSASARANVNTRVLALFRKDLDRLSELHPDISTHIYRSLANIIGNRLKATNELLEKKIKAAA